MPICKHCQHEVTIAATGDETCPACGLPFDLSDVDWELDDEASQTDSGQPEAASAEETAREIDDADAGEKTEAFGGIEREQDDDLETLVEPPSPTGSQNLAGPEAAVDMTHAFGGKFAEDEDSWDGVEEVALGAEDEDDGEATAGPGDVTAPFIDPTGTAAEGGDEDSQTAPGAADTDRMNPDMTVAFTGDGADSDSASDTNFELGADTQDDPGDMGGTLLAGSPELFDSDSPSPNAPPSDAPSSNAPSSGSEFAGTLPAGLSGSDRQGSGPPPDTKNEGDASSGGDTGTLAVDGDSDRRSDRVETPKPREVTGLESGNTIPRVLSDDDRMSQSLRPGDTHVVGPENVRLRAYRIGKDERRGPNDFSIETKTFKGGMGVVHGMRQGSLDRMVAVKQVKPEMSSNESDRNKFISEAVITGQLEHPNIIPVHDLGLASDGLPFYSMKFVEGDEWEDNIKSLTEEENLSILIQVAQAIAFAHSKGIIHRDLKPGNVMLGGYGEVLVMDWGLAARIEDADDIPPSGTPVYMPPETALQYLDYAKGRVGGKKSTTRRVPPGTYSDIYLLGGLLFKIVTGKAPHKGKTTFECLKGAAKNQITKTSRKSELLDIAYKAMKTDPGERHRDVGEFIDEIKEYQAHAQSNKIARQAWQDLRSAEKAKEDASVEPRILYDSYNSARYGFENALELWAGNKRAEKRLVESKRKHAETAYGIGDFDLALTLLDPDNPDDDSLIAEVRESQSQRNRKLALFRTLQYAVAASLVVAIGALILTGIVGYDAFTQRKVAAAAKQEADEALIAAGEAEQLAVEKQAEAKLAVDRADEAQQKADDANRRLVDANDKLEQADAKLEEANRQLVDASEKLEDAEEKAQDAIEKQEEAEQLADEFEQKAIEEQYAAVQNGVLSVLAERGEYAAWKELRKTYPPDQDQELRERGSGWDALLRKVDWQREASEVIASLEAPRTAVTADGQTLVVAAGREVCVYQGGDTKEPTARWQLVAPVEQLVVSHDGALIAVLDDVSSAPMLYRAADGRPMEVGDDATTAGAITAIAFDPRGDRLITGDAGTGIAVWRLDSEENTVDLSAAADGWHTNRIESVGFSPDGRLMFAADRGGHVSFWADDQPVTQSPISYLHGGKGTGSPFITAACVTTDGDQARFAYGCRDGAAYVLNFSIDAATAFAASRFVSLRYDEGTPSRLELQPFKLPTTHDRRVSAIAFANEGGLVVSAGGSTLMVRDAVAGSDSSLDRERHYHDSTVLSLAVTASGQVYSSEQGRQEEDGRQAGRVVQWSVNVKANPARLEPRRGEPRGAVATIGVNPQGSAVVVGDRLGYIRNWSDPFASTEYERRFAGHADHRRMRAWRLAGPEPRIVTVGADRMACVWDGAEGGLLHTIDLYGRQVVTPSANGQKLITATDQQSAARAPAAAVSLAGGQETPLWTNRPRVSALKEFTRPGADSEPVIAVGLRDGQLYLWTPTQGRVELGNRAHWRQIRAIEYDAATDALLVADNDGLLTRWQLRAGRLASEAPTQAFLATEGVLSRMELSQQGKLLVVSRRPGDAVVQLIDARTLQPATPTGFAIEGLIDATFNASGESVLALKQGSRVVRWTGDAWREVEGADRIAGKTSRRGLAAGIRCAADGSVMLFGDGFLQVWSSVGNDARLLCQAESRALPTAAMPTVDGDVLALSNRGRLDAWAAAGQTRLTPSQVELADAGARVRACPSSEAGKVFLATQSPEGGCSIILTDLATSNESGRTHEIASGRVAAMHATTDWLAVAVDESGRPRVELFRLSDGKATTLTLPMKPVAVAVTEGELGLQVAAADRAGRVEYATRGEDGAWTAGRLKDVTATALAFTPAGDRLVYGSPTGRVAMLAVEGFAEGAYPSRVVLNFDRHSDSVSVLQFGNLAGRPTLLSGDRSGAVLVRTL